MAEDHGKHVHAICIAATPGWMARVVNDCPGWSPCIGVDKMAVEYQILNEVGDINHSLSFYWDGIDGPLSDDKITELARECADKLCAIAKGDSPAELARLRGIFARLRDVACPSGAKTVDVIDYAANGPGMEGTLLQADLRHIADCWREALGEGGGE